MSTYNSKVSLLQVDNLEVFYRISEKTVRAVDGVSFSVEKGEALALVGESGSGKSSLALGLIRVLPRNLAKYSGLIRLNETDCLNLDEDTFRKEIRWRRISMVFQAAMESLNPVTRVGHQVIEPLLLANLMSKREAVSEGLRLLELVRLPREVFYIYAE